MHNDLLKVAENPGLRRDRSTNAVLDVDRDAYQRYKKLKQSKKEQQERVDVMENRINNMESDIADIKSLLIRLLEK